VGLSVLVFAFLVWRFSTIWFTRDSILQAAPDSTILAIEFHITPKTWPIIKKILGNTPLISDRSFDIEDLASLTHGDLAIFVTKDGDRAVAIRNSSGSLPNDLMESYGITSQEVGSGVVLLSQTLLPINGFDSSVRHSFLPSFALWLGRVELPDIGLSGSLTWSEEALQMSFKTQKTNDNGGALHPASLSMLLTERTAGDLPSVSAFFLKQASPLIDLQQKNHQILVQKDANGAAQVLISVPNSGWDEEALINTLETMGAYLSPKIAEKILSDGTTSLELLVEPDIVAVEEVSVSGNSLFRVPGEGRLTLYGGFINGSTILSTSEETISSFLEPTKGTCDANQALINPTDLLKQTAQISYDPQVISLLGILSDISAVSIETKKYSTKVRFCSI
jgi:hypothetical protein